MFITFRNSSLKRWYNATGSKGIIRDLQRWCEMLNGTNMMIWLKQRFSSWNWLCSASTELKVFPDFCFVWCYVSSILIFTQKFLHSIFNNLDLLAKKKKNNTHTQRKKQHPKLLFKSSNKIHQVRKLQVII